MSFSFNLIDQPWIPCIRGDGTLTEVGLRELLLDAHNLRALACETPLHNAAIMPVALALLHRVFGPSSKAEWKSLWQSGAFPPEALNDYFAKWYERFDLFHPERPFYQVHDERLSPKSSLYLAESIANSDTLFDHRTEESFSPFTPPEAALTLLAAQFFRLGGGITGKETPNLVDGTQAKGITLFASGETLFKTFMLNLFLYPSEAVMPHSKFDKPVWEHDDPLHGKRPKKELLNLAPTGYLDFLTWQTFHIRLVPVLDEIGRTVVPSSVVIPVARLVQESSLTNPFKTLLKSSSSEEWKIVGLDLEKALWRDYHAFLPFREDVKPPFLIEWLSGLADRSVIDVTSPFQLLAIAIVRERRKAAKALAYRQEQIMVPPIALLDESIVNSIEYAIKRAEQVAQSLREALNILADQVLMRGGEQPPDKADRHNLVEQWDSVSLYWERLEPAFWQFLETLSQGQSGALDAWNDVLEQQARDALADAASNSGTSAPALKGQVIAELRLRFRLNKLFNEQE